MCPVPFFTTLTIISVSVRAVSGLITCRTATGSKERTSRPCPSSTARTICGCISRPPLATAAKAATICTAVTEISCPIDMVASERPDHWLGGRSRPRLSPGSPRLVGAPNPKAVMYL